MQDTPCSFYANYCGVVARDGGSGWRLEDSAFYVVSPVWS